MQDCAFPIMKSPSVSVLLLWFPHTQFQQVVKPLVVVFRHEHLLFESVHVNYADLVMREIPRTARITLRDVHCVPSFSRFHQ